MWCVFKGSLKPVEFPSLRVGSDGFERRVNLNRIQSGCDYKRKTSDQINRIQGNKGVEVRVEPDGRWWSEGE